MKVAVLADIHANLHALEAVLADAERLGCERVWSLGDYLGYGACPDEVVALLARSPGDCVIGNYDTRALRCGGPVEGRPNPKSPAKRFLFRWSYAQLSAANRRVLASLPPVRRKRVLGRRFLLTHAGGARGDRIIDARTPADDLAELADRAKADVLLFGHTHRTFDRTVNRVRLLNPGPVGRPEDGDPRASYAVLTVARDRLTVRRRRVAYDLRAAVRAIEDAGLPEAFARMLRDGRRLETVLARMAPRPACPQERRPQDDPLLASASALAEDLGDDLDHSRHVTHLALGLFDVLQRYHCLGRPMRRLLHCAGLLHDIGWVHGRRRHHKNARDMILDAPGLPLDDRSRVLVALTARYHRRALPAERHTRFAELNAGDRYRVWMLGGILRVADGLDASHQGCVQEVAADVSTSCVTITAHLRYTAADEIATANSKSAMLAAAFAREVRVIANGSI